MILEPIGYFEAQQRYSYDAARQGALAGENRGVVVLNPGCNYEQALQDLGGFSHSWLLYQFHHNPNWKPLVMPPRGIRKVGVFASRAPYRPNPIGLSCVELVAINGLRLEVRNHDLLDGTPILDIKPYLPYADSVPEATTSWLAELDDSPWQINFAPSAEQQLAWLEGRGAGCIRGFILQQLAEQPLNVKKKRLRPLDTGAWEIAYRTWRICFIAHSEDRVIDIQMVYSGYTAEELHDSADPYGDKAIHHAFQETFALASSRNRAGRP